MQYMPQVRSMNKVGGAPLGEKYTAVCSIRLPTPLVSET
jgi:hypothetical protein